MKTPYSGIITSGIITSGIIANDHGWLRRGRWLMVAVSAVMMTGFVHTAIADEAPAASSATTGERSATAAAFPLKAGDHVVLVGGTYIEREGQFGDLETALTAQFPRQRITFRNLGWSGDTVWAESRGIFDPPAVGYQRLIDLVIEQKPTVIVLHYGQNEAFRGPDGLESFRQQYAKLCDDLAVTKARLAFITPWPMSAAGARVPPRTAVNQQIAAYASVVRELAQSRGMVIDMHAQVTEWESQQSPDARAQCFQGIHLNRTGSRMWAGLFCQAAGLPTAVNLETESMQALRTMIVRKNELFFHRWRPQNVTYLFGFRKHEQGNNAVEIPQFDPLIAELEEQIHQQLQSSSR
jgi:hypothetical protein